MSSMRTTPSVQALPFILRVLLSPPSGIPISLFDISAPAMLLVLAVPLWLYSGSIADRVAGSGNAAVEDERLEFPFELGVGLIGLVFLVQGASGLAGEAVDSFLSGSGSVFGTIRPSGVVEARDVAVFSTEAALGLVLFVGADAIVGGIRFLRSWRGRTPDDAED